MKKLTLLFILPLLMISCKKEGEIEMVSPEQVYEAIHADRSLQLLDVRTLDAYTVSHLKNAQNICVSSSTDFKEKAALLDKDKPVYVYCKGGVQSAQAAEILKEMGFTKVYDLQGGLNQWTEQGYETVN